jgi:hypothetical protein
MVEQNEGLRKIYNRFHDPEERSNAIGELRRLHDAMGRAVLEQSIRLSNPALHLLFIDEITSIDKLTYHRLLRFSHARHARRVPSNGGAARALGSA